MREDELYFCRDREMRLEQARWSQERREEGPIYGYAFYQNNGLTVVVCDMPLIDVCIGGINRTGPSLK